MITGREELIIPIGGRYKKTYDFLDGLGDAEDFEGLTATLKIKNIAEEFEDEDAFECVGAVTVEPLDSDSNIIKGRLVVDIAATDTAKIKIPESERDIYGESDRYAVMTVQFDNGEIPLIITIRPITPII